MAVRHAYLNFNAALVRLTRASRQSDPDIKADLSGQVHDYLKKCAGYLLQAVDGGLKSAAAGVVITPPDLVTVIDEVTAELKDDSTEEDYIT